MITNSLVLDVYGSLARYSAEGQRVSASNISRANEPGYKAEVLESFEEYLTRQISTEAAEGLSSDFRITESRAAAAPNGNNVALEEEVMRGTAAIGQHEMAMTVYSKSLDLLRTALGRGR